MIFRGENKAYLLQQMHILVHYIEKNKVRKEENYERKNHRRIWKIWKYYEGNR